MTGHFICESCGYDGEHADYCAFLRPAKDRWKGNRTKKEMEELKKQNAAPASVAWYLPSHRLRYRPDRIGASVDDDEITTIKCHHCNGGLRTTGCWHCNSTGRLFWIAGYAFPYTPEGEQRAKRVQDAMNHNQLVK